jgi:predicted CXXCH cytochrome family protein
MTWAAGDKGDEGSSFLRLDNRQGQLCLTCHSEQQHAVTGPHRAAAPAGGSACVGCHTPHNAAQDGLMQVRASVTDRSALLAGSPWPKGGLEWNPQSWNDGDRACLACHSDPAVHERVPAAWAHPRVTLGEMGKAHADKDGTQPVTCVTCHDPHIEQAGLIARPSAETPCASCHGDEALWRYRYYHDPVRRNP